MSFLDPRRGTITCAAQSDALSRAGSNHPGNGTCSVNPAATEHRPPIFRSLPPWPPGLTASSFFQPYIEDLRTILRDKGISVLEAHPSVYHQRQDVVDDVLDEQRREDSELPAEKRKGYDTLLHDVVLWHAVNDRRSTNADTPFEVEYWGCVHRTVSDCLNRSKRFANRSKLPVACIPAT